MLQPASPTTPLVFPPSSGASNRIARTLKRVEWVTPGRVSPIGSYGDGVRYSSDAMATHGFESSARIGAGWRSEQGSIAGLGSEFRRVALEVPPLVYEFVETLGERVDVAGLVAVEPL